MTRMEDRIMRERPAGITVVATVFFAIGIFSLLWGGLVLGIGGLSALFGSLFNAERMTSFGNTSAWSGYLGILSAIVQIAVGVGMVGMQKWSWYLGLAAVVLTILTGIVGIFLGGTFAFICGSLGLVVPILILIYLLRRGVRTAFGIGASQ
jgi:hypothetical protein